MCFIAVDLYLQFCLNFCIESFDCFVLGSPSTKPDDTNQPDNNTEQSQNDSQNASNNQNTRNSTSEHSHALADSIYESICKDTEEKPTTKGQQAFRDKVFENCTTTSIVLQNAR